MDNSYEFDQIIDRRNTNCAKWDTQAKKYKRKDLIHLGVADMDFRSPEPILQGFQEIVNHGIFGYTDLNDGFYSSIQKWLKKKTTIDIPKEWIVFCPRISISASICVDALTADDASIIINAPTYSPLKNAIIKNNRKAIDNPLLIKDNKFTIDINYLETIVNDKTEMLILCNPDNPSGRVWSIEELREIALFCQKHDLLLFSDEIHSDIISGNLKHNSTISLYNILEDKLICANSMTKTFNIPGVIVSYLIIPDGKIRNKVKAAIDRIGIHNPTIFAVSAVETGYNYCESWINEVNEYIDQNESLFRNYINKYMPEFEVMPREGTYMIWINYSALNVSEEELKNWFINEAKVEVYMGSDFGEYGRGYFRANIATSKLILKKALERMHKSYPKILRKC